MTKVIKKVIPKKVNNIVVFVHGFGVRWDSRGMFTEIKDSLPNDWGYVLFDFYDVSGEDVYIASISQQLKLLNEILNEVSSENNAARIHIIAHSKGCVVTALAMPKIDGKVILLAPPETFGKNLQDYFEKYPGVQRAKNEIIIPRKDGTITHIPNSYFKESLQIQPEEEILKLSKQSKVIIFQTTEDEVIGQTSYTKLQSIPNIEIIPIISDHNFTGDYRKHLIKQLKDLLK